MDERVTCFAGAFFTALNRSPTVNRLIDEGTALGLKRLTMGWANLNR